MNSEVTVLAEFSSPRVFDNPVLHAVALTDSVPNDSDTVVDNAVAVWVVNDSTSIRTEVSSIKADSDGLCADSNLERSSVVLRNISPGFYLNTSVVFRVVITSGLKGLVLPVICLD